MVEEPAPSTYTTLETRQRLSEDAFNAVRLWILSGELPADQIVSERELATRLGLSRTPVREAVGRLVGEGLLRWSGRTVLVNAVRMEDVLEILSLRRLLEGEAVKLATARIARATLLELRNNEHRLLVKRTVTAEEHWRVEDTFHTTIAEASGHRLLAKNVHELRERTRLYGFNKIPQRLEPGRSEHISILDAMLEGATDLASVRMEDHLQNVANAILDSLGARRATSRAG